MIEAWLEKSNKPCVFFSGGKDSLIVLDKVHTLKPDIDVFVFKQDMHSEQWKIIETVIRLWDLQVITFPPSHTYFIPNGDEVSRVDEYSLNGFPLPVIRDFTDGPHCAFEIDQRRLPIFPFEHDVVFVGAKSRDKSFIVNQPFKREVTSIGPITFVAPLFNWSDEQVEEAAKNLPYSKEWYIGGDERFDTGNVVACTNCLKATKNDVYCLKEKGKIHPYDWDRSGMLKGFQEKFGFSNT
jgi:3'-phosphoadenosine 5'-phosphosulfate sulfotransferase (PAPS reductase)/FAD synthetase